MKSLYPPRSRQIRRPLTGLLSLVLVALLLSCRVMAFGAASLPLDGMDSQQITGHHAMAAQGEVVGHGVTLMPGQASSMADMPCCEQLTTDDECCNELLLSSSQPPQFEFSPLLIIGDYFASKFLEPQFSRPPPIDRRLQRWLKTAYPRTHLVNCTQLD